MADREIVGRTLRANIKLGQYSRRIADAVVTISQNLRVGPADHLHGLYNVVLQI